MDCCEIRPWVKSGDILVWLNTAKHGDKIGSLVRLATLSDYVHVGIALVQDNEIKVAEANLPSVRIKDVTSFDDVYYIRTPIKHDSIGEEFIRSTQGLKYSIKNCIMAVIGTVSRSEDEYQCAEYVLEYCKLYGYDLGKAFTPSKIVHASMDLFDSPMFKLEKI